MGTAAFNYYQANRDRFLQGLTSLLKIPSVSTLPEHKPDVRRAAEFVAEELRSMGIENAEIIDGKEDQNPLVYAEWLGAQGKPTVLVYGHYDVQPPDPLEEWITPPFEPTIRDGRLYARGVGDNKAQHFANLLALESFLACRGTLPCNVKVLLEGEEEVGSPHMPEFVREHRDELLADLLFFSDGPVHENGQSTLCFGVRGVLDIELRAYGAKRDLHSGHWGGIVPNPLWTLVHLLASMKNERGEVTIDGFYEHVLPVTDRERESLAELPIDVDEVKHSLGLKRLDEPQERAYFERLAVWPTLTINGIHGGYGGPGSKTVLPHEAVAKLDIRLVEAQTADEILAKVKAHVQRHAPEVSVISHGGMDPSKTPLDSPFTDLLRQAITAAQGEEPLFVPAMGGSLPNYVFT